MLSVNLLSSEEHMLVLLLGSSPGIASTLLILWWGSSKPFCDQLDGCAILEELDYLCGLNELQVLSSHGTSSDTSKKQN